MDYYVLIRAQTVIITVTVFDKRKSFLANRL